MSVTLTNDSGLTPPPFDCFQSTVGRYIFSTCILLYILPVLPLSLFVLFLGVQRWWQQRSMSAAEAVSPSDFFTYNLAVIELIGALMYALFVWTTESPSVGLFVQYLGMFCWFGQTLTPILTCVERYLAVVHPITYLSLKKVGRVRVRNISMGCVWLLSLGGAGLVVLFMMNPEYGILPVLPVLILLLVAMTFCSLSALRVLFRPRPGKASGGRTQVDQSKQRAIQTIVIIMGVLWVKFGWNVIAISLRSSPLPVVKCLGSASVTVSSLPNSLLSPLLFLHRAGKLPNCRNHSGPGR